MTDRSSQPTGAPPNTSATPPTGRRPGPAATPPPGSRPSARTPPPPQARRPPSLVGIAIVATAGLVALWVTVGVFLPAIGEIGNAVKNPASLPRTLELCGGTWARGAAGTTWTLAEVFVRDDREPVVVTDSGPGVCPVGACRATAPDEGCATIVYVKAGADEYVPYETVTEP